MPLRLNHAVPLVNPDEPGTKNEAIKASWQTDFCWVYLLLLQVTEPYQPAALFLTLAPEVYKLQVQAIVFLL